MVQASSVIALCASMLLALCATFGIPISWTKLQLGSLVRWIGWNFNLRAQVVSVPEDKLHKLLAACVAVLEPRHTTKQSLESLVGLLHWLLHIAPVLKPWLSCLYNDLARPLGTSFSLNPGTWQLLPKSLDDSMHFTSSPAGSGIPVGGKLLSAKHVELHRKSDLQLVQADLASHSRSSDGKKEAQCCELRVREVLDALGYLLATHACIASSTLCHASGGGCRCYGIG